MPAMIEASPTLLEYAPPIPRLRPVRRVLRWMIFVLTIITVLVVMRNAIQDQIIKWQHRQAVNAMLRMQNDCLNYTIPAKMLVFNRATGAAFHPMLYDQLVQSLGPSFGLENLGFDIGGGILFMHEVDLPVGKRVLMIVNLHEPAAGTSAYMLRCYRMQLGDANHPSEIDHVSCPLSIHALPLAEVRAYAGQTVVGDASRFTLPIVVNGRPILIACSLRDDELVHFQASDGMLISSDQPREGAALFCDRLPSPEDVLNIRYSPTMPPIRQFSH